MDKKPIAAVVIAAVLLTVLLTQFTVVYPYNPNETVQVTNQKFFGGSTPQIPPLGKFGINNTNITGFTPTVQANVTIEGYATAAATGQPLANQKIAITIFPATAETTTGPDGFFSFDALYAGSGTFGFKIPYYKAIYRPLNLVPPAIWVNLSFSRDISYQISGTLVSSNGSAVPSARISFNGFFYASQAVSSSNGDFSASLYNDTYAISVYYPNYNTVPSPHDLNVSGKSITGLVLIISPLVNGYIVSGYIHNTSGNPIGGALVSDNSNFKSSYSSGNGYYSLSVSLGVNSIAFSHAGYATNSTFLNIKGNITDFNVTLHMANPFGVNGYNISGNSTINGTTLYNYLGNNSSTIVQSSSGNYVLTGKVGVSAPGGRIIFLGGVNITFYTSINGSFFNVTVRTNSTGWYSLGLVYRGTYQFLVTTYLTYPFKTPAIAVSKSLTFYNMTLIPRPGTIYTVTGSIQNSILHRDVQNSTINFRGSLNGSEVVSSTFYSQTGSFSIYLIIGNYTFVVSGPGYQNLYIPVSGTAISSGNPMIFYITPVLIPSAGFVKIPGNRDTEGIQGLTQTELEKNLTSDSLTYNYSAVTLQLNFLYKGLPLKNQSIGLYLATDGLYFFSPILTNQTGSYSLHLGFSGKFTILVESQRFYSAGMANMSVTANSSLTVVVYERQVYNVLIALYNSATHSKVPDIYLNLTNSAVQIAFNISYASNETNFSYYLPSGLYNFSYSNPGYVSRSFSFNVEGKANSTYISIEPRLIYVIGASSVLWGYNLTFPNGSVLSAPNLTPGPYSGSADAITGSYALEAWVYFGGKPLPVKSSAFSVVSTNPSKTAYINITNSSTLFPLIAESDTSGNQYVNYSYTVNLNSGFMYNLTFNATITNFNLELNGNPLQYSSYSQANFNGYPGTLINLSSPLQISSSVTLSVLVKFSQSVSPFQASNISISYVTGNISVVI